MLYTSDHGLSNDYVREVTKDRQGFLWVATHNGLNRFDGHTFRRFFHDPEKPGGLPDNFIKSITQGPDGSLWTSGPKGICRIDPLALELRHFVFPENKDTLEDNDEVGRVVFDPGGKGWVCAKNVLYHFDPVTGAYDAYPLEEPYPGNHFTYLDRTGKIWLIDRGMVGYFNPQTRKVKTLATYTSGGSLQDSAPQQIQEDQTGKLWVSTWFKGLGWYDPALDSLIDYPDERALATAIRPDISPDGRPFLWLGGGHYGIYVLYPDTGEEIQFPPDPRDPYTHNNYLAGSIFKDESDGSLWIATEAGLEHYAPTALRFGRVILPVGASFGQFSLMSGAMQDNTDPTGNTFYIAMWGSGLFKWDRKKNTFTQFHVRNSGLKNDGILCAMQDRKGFIWAGTAGISRFDPRTGSWRSWECSTPEMQGNCNFLSCIEDPDGGLWFGTNQRGLYHYNASTGEVEPVELPAEAYHPDKKLRITNLSLDPQGRIWLANNLRPMRFDPRSGKVEFFRIKNSKTNYNQWRDVVPASNGRIYAISQNSIIEMDSACKVLRVFDQKNGLRSNSLVFLEEDRLGRIWCNSTYLLHCLDPATGQFTYYGTADGLFKNTITDGLIALPNGEFFIGFQNAFNYFDPANLPLNTIPPPVVITSVKVMDKERKAVIRKTFRMEVLFGPRSITSWQDTLIIVRPGEDIFTIEFAALNFNQPARNRYAYMLEGFNDDWVPSQLNQVTYTNLDEGEYWFRVKAANNDGVWNETGARIRIKVIPPLVRRWYFKIMVGIAGALGLLGFWYYRQNQRKRLENFRESLARDLHDDMGSTLSSIRFFSDFANQQVGGTKPEIASILQRISQSAGALSESMQDIVWAMKRKNDQLEDLAARMTEFGFRLLEARSIAFKTQIMEGFSGKNIRPEVRRNIYLIFKETVTNAAKYAGATEVELFLSLKKGLLLMKISDNGIGFDLTKGPVLTAGGNGIPNMQKRAEEIGGTLEIISEKNIGTSVEVKVRV